MRSKIYKTALIIGLTVNTLLFPFITNAQSTQTQTAEDMFNLIDSGHRLKKVKIHSNIGVQEYIENIVLKDDQGFVISRDSIINGNEIIFDIHHHLNIGAANGFKIDGDVIKLPPQKMIFSLHNIDDIEITEQENKSTLIVGTEGLKSQEVEIKQTTNIHISEDSREDSIYILNDEDFVSIIRSQWNIMDQKDFYLEKLRIVLEGKMIKNQERKDMRVHINGTNYDTKEIVTTDNENKIYADFTIERDLFSQDFISLSIDTKKTAQNGSDITATIDAKSITFHEGNKYYNQDNTLSSKTISEDDITGQVQSYHEVKKPQIESLVRTDSYGSMETILAGGANTELIEFAIQGNGVPRDLILNGFTIDQGDLSPIEQYHIYVNGELKQSIQGGEETMIPDLSILIQRYETTHIRIRGNIKDDIEGDFSLTIDAFQLQDSKGNSLSNNEIVQSAYFTITSTPQLIIEGNNAVNYSSLINAEQEFHLHSLDLKSIAGDLEIHELTLVNIYNENTEQFATNNTVKNNASDGAIVSLHDWDGKTLASSILNNGTAYFSFTEPIKINKDIKTELNVNVKAKSINDEFDSNQSFKRIILAPQEIINQTQRTVILAKNGNSIAPSNISRFDAQSHVHYSRKTQPIIQSQIDSDTLLGNGYHDIYRFDIGSNNGKKLLLKELRVDLEIDGDIELSDPEIYLNNTRIDTEKRMIYFKKESCHNYQPRRRDGIMCGRRGCDSVKNHVGSACAIIRFQDSYENGVEIDSNTNFMFEANIQGAHHEGTKLVARIDQISDNPNKNSFDKQQDQRTSIIRSDQAAENTTLETTNRYTDALLSSLPTQTQTFSLISSAGPQRKRTRIPKVNAQQPICTGPQREIISTETLNTNTNIGDTITLYGFTIENLTTPLQPGASCNDGTYSTIDKTIGVNCLCGSLTPLECKTEGEYEQFNTGPNTPEIKCCQGLSSFDTDPNQSDNFGLCYDPAKGEPSCGRWTESFEVGAWGRIYPNNEVLKIEDCQQTEPSIIAVDDTYTVTCSGDAIIDVLANDMFLDSSEITLSIISQPDNNRNFSVENNKIVVSSGSQCSTHQNIIYQIKDGDNQIATGSVEHRSICDACGAENTCHTYEVCEGGYQRNEETCSCKECPALICEKPEGCHYIQTPGAPGFCSGCGELICPNEECKTEGTLTLRKDSDIVFRGIRIEDTNNESYTSTKTGEEGAQDIENRIKNIFSMHNIDAEVKIEYKETALFNVIYTFTGSDIEKITRIITYTKPKQSTQYIPLSPDCPTQETECSSPYHKKSLRDFPATTFDKFDKEIKGDCPADTGILNFTGKDGKRTRDCVAGTNNEKIHDTCIFYQDFCGDGKTQTEDGEECDPEESSECSEECKTLQEGVKCGTKDKTTIYSLTGDGALLSSSSTGLCDGMSLSNQQISVINFEYDEDDHKRTWGCVIGSEESDISCSANESFCGNDTKEGSEQCDGETNSCTDGASCNSICQCQTCHSDAGTECKATNDCKGTISCSGNECVQVEEKCTNPSDPNYDKCGGCKYSDNYGQSCSLDDGCYGIFNKEGNCEKEEGKEEQCSCALERKEPCQIEEGSSCYGTLACDGTTCETDEPALERLIGQSCSDGNPLTNNDKYTSSCVCEGQGCILPHQTDGNYDKYDNICDNTIFTKKANKVTDKNIIEYSIFAGIREDKGRIIFEDTITGQGKIIPGSFEIVPMEPLNGIRYRNLEISEDRQSISAEIYDKIGKREGNNFRIYYQVQIMRVS